ncbi:uncharacterized protein LOC144477603 [Augochlora pura]
MAPRRFIELASLGRCRTVDNSGAENRNLSSDDIIRHLVLGEIFIMDKDAASHCILSSRVYFADETRCLAKGQTVKGKLQQLNPFLDEDRMLRVGRRLKHSPMPFSEKYPLILPKARAPIVADRRTQPNLESHKGVRDLLLSPTTAYELYNGESTSTSSNGIQTVFKLKAVDLELASDLTSEAFIAALRRFIARRGYCTHLYSDNGSNFVGTYNEFRELRELLKSVDHQNKAPHFGGLWEAAVKSFKYHLKRVAGNELFTFENFNTLITEIEAILNSRPLTPISSDANDLLALTPGHFLIGDSLTSLRERDFRDTPSNRLSSSWQQIQKIKQHFWNRWRREYLNELTCRH